MSYNGLCLTWLLAGVSGLVGQGALPLTLAAGTFVSKQIGVTIWIAP